MIGVILAAGMAKRLRPLTDDKPKCLLTVGGITLLERTVRAMQQTGITEFVVVTGYRGDMIRAFLDNYAHQTALTFRFLHNADYAHNNNIYSLWMAGTIVRDREFLLMDSDILCYPQVVKRIADEPVAALAVNCHPLGEEEMKVVADAHGNIIAINKTCQPQEAVGESVGIEKFTAAMSTALYRELDKMILQEQLVDVFYERAFERLIPLGFTFRLVDTTAYFSYEIDTPEDYETVCHRWEEEQGNS